jgi:hypothetical protein
MPRIVTYLGAGLNVSDTPVPVGDNKTVPGKMLTIQDGDEVHQIAVPNDIAREVGEALLSGSKIVKASVLDMPSGGRGA